MFDFICIGFAELWASGRENSKWKYVPPTGIKPATPCIPARRSNNSAIKTVNDLLKLKSTFLRYYQSIRAAMNVWNWFWLDVHWIQGRRRRGHRGHVPPHFQKLEGHKWVCVPSLFVNELRHCQSESAFLLPIYMLYITVYRTFINKNQTMINFRLALSHLLINSSAHFPLLTARRRPCKWNQAWNSSRVMVAQR